MIARQVALEELLLDLLVHSEADLRAEVVDLSQQLRAYRELATCAIGALADMTRDRNRVRQRYHALLNQCRQEGARRHLAETARTALAGSAMAAGDRGCH